MKRLLILWISLSMYSGLVAQETTLTDPGSYFGFRPGADRKLFSYEELIAYLQKLDEESPRISMQQIGKSPTACRIFPRSWRTNSILLSQSPPHLSCL